MDIKVSVLCVTYNQEDYIRDALDSFLSQKTDFDFEILVHDDCSTDSTADIIREYEAKYPDKVRGIYAPENTYLTNGGRYFSRRLAPVAKGDIVAFCEGDDYWINDNKLQSQYDYFCAHPECTACTNRAISVDATSGEELGFVGPAESGVLSFEDILSNWSSALPDGQGAWMLSTASYAMRKDICINFDKDWDFKTPVGDLSIILYAASKGDVYYDATPGTVYRYQSKNSWSSYARRNRSDKRYDVIINDYNARTIDMALNMDEATDGKYHDVLLKRAQNFACWLIQGEGIFAFFRDHREKYGYLLTPAMYVRGEAGYHFFCLERLLFKFNYEIVKDPSGKLHLEKAREFIADPETGLSLYE